MARSAAPRTNDDSVTVNQLEIWCPDSCQMISGRVVPITAAQAMRRGKKLDGAGVSGLICLRPLPLRLRHVVERHAQFFKIWNLRYQPAQRFHRGGNMFEECLVAFDEAEESVGAQRLHQSLDSATPKGRA